jgi:phage terminase large subunit GpA-like protein
MRPDILQELNAAAAASLGRTKPIKPSEWAAKYRVLTAAESSEPGRWRNEATPYLPGIMDAVADPEIQEVVFVKPTQVGGSELLRNLLGYWIDNDPSPGMFVLPNEEATEQIIRERIRPLLMNTPQLRQHVSESPRDNTLSYIRTLSMPVYFGWAGSPQSLASRPCRWVCFDECDKYPPFSGRESDPISLASERTATYKHRRKLIKISTPTVRNAPIWKAWEACSDRRFFFVPCPKCNAFQKLIWSQVKWPKLDTDGTRRADEIDSQQLAYYECEKCGDRWSDQAKRRAVGSGRWEGSGRPSSSVGFHLNSIYSPWRTLSKMAAEFIRAEGDVALTMNFRNSRLAEPFEEVTATSRPTMFREKAQRAESANQRPEWAVTVMCTADVQKDSLWFAIRAWGYGFKSHLIRYGQVRDFNELYAEAFSKPHAFLGQDKLGVCELLAIDGKYRTNEVFEFARRDPSRILITQGNPQPTGPMVTPKLEGGIRVLKLNTLRTKDRLNQLLLDGDLDRWLPHADIGDEYASQMASEHRTWDAKSGCNRWEPKYHGIANHLWDCEANQCAIATWKCLDVPAEHAIKPTQQSPQPAAASATKWIDRPANWI